MRANINEAKASASPEDKATAEQRQQNYKKELPRQLAAAVARQYRVAEEWSKTLGKEVETQQPPKLYSYEKTGLKKALDDVRKKCK